MLIYQGNPDKGFVGFATYEFRQYSSLEEFKTCWKYERFNYLTIEE